MKMHSVHTINYLAGFAIVSIVMATLYVVVKQTYNMNTNHQQIQLDRNIHDSINERKSPALTDAVDTTDYKNGMQVLIRINKNEHRQNEYQASLNNLTLQLPSGVYDFSNTNKEEINLIPQTSTVLGKIILSINHPETKIIAAGRSLKEIQKTGASLSQTVFIAWLICLLIIVFSGIINFVIEKNEKQL